MPAIIFADGTRVTGPSFRAIERQLRRDPWNPRWPIAFREEMARRAKAWSGERIRTRGSSRAFLQELENAGLIRIEETP